MFIACHYWDPKFPKLFSLKQINEFLPPAAHIDFNEPKTSIFEE